MPQKHCKNNQWIIKNVKAAAGINIHMFKKIDEIGAFLIKQLRQSRWVLQKYIESPLLYNNRKFDLRMHVMFMTGDETKELNILLYKEGYLRTSSSQYNINSTDMSAHLTNSHIQY